MPHGFASRLRSTYQAIHARTPARSVPVRAAPVAAMFAKYGFTLVVVYGIAPSERWLVASTLATR
jgi:hypothetical protein